MFDSFRPIVDQIQAIWNESSPAGRIGLGALAVACVAILVGVGMWSSQPDYVPLASGLSLDTTNKLIAKLDDAQIPYEVNRSGTGVSVASSSWSKARLVTGQLTDETGTALPTFEPDILSDPSLNFHRLREHKEAQLSATISRMAGVEAATVLIKKSKPSPFTVETEPPGASVQLSIKPGHGFSRSQAGAIVAMVASSVEGMSPENVNVVDTRGRILYSHQSGPANEMNQQFEYRQRLEMELAAKAETMLAEVLGPGKSRVRITADVDFTQTERTQTTYDPALKVKKKEKISSTSESGMGPGSSGAAGIAANSGAPGGGAAGGGEPFTSKKEENETEYENPKTENKVREAGGRLLRLTVAAMVDVTPDPVVDPTADDGSDPNATSDPANQAAPTPLMTQASVEKIIQTAVGFDATRGDEIAVVLSEFAPLPTTTGPVADGWSWNRIEDLVRLASLGIASLVALVMGMLILKRMKPVKIEPEPSAYVTPDRARMLAQLTDRASRDPESAARIVKLWLGEELPQPRRRAGDDPNTPLPERKAA